MRVCVFFLCIFLMASPAYAYIDPGVGSVILQLLLGGLAGAGVFLKLHWKKAKHFVGGGKHHASTAKKKKTSRAKTRRKR